MLSEIDIVLLDKIASFLDWKDLVNFCFSCKSIYRISKKYENEIWKKKVKINEIFKIENYKKFHINMELNNGLVIEYFLHKSFDTENKIRTDLWKIRNGKNMKENLLPHIFLPGYRIEDIENNITLYITEFYSYDVGAEKRYITSNLREAKEYNFLTYKRELLLNDSIERRRYELRFYELRVELF
jgi:hypothetical protein